MCAIHCILMHAMLHRVSEIWSLTVFGSQGMMERDIKRQCTCIKFTSNLSLTTDTRVNNSWLWDTEYNVYITQCYYLICRCMIWTFSLGRRAVSVLTVNIFWVWCLRESCEGVSRFADLLHYFDITFCWTHLLGFPRCWLSNQPIKNSQLLPACLREIQNQSKLV